MPELTSPADLAAVLDGASAADLKETKMNAKSTESDPVAVERMTKTLERQAKAQAKESANSLAEADAARARDAREAAEHPIPELKRKPRGAAAKAANQAAVSRQVKPDPKPGKASTSRKASTSAKASTPTKARSSAKANASASTRKPSAAAKPKATSSKTTRKPAASAKARPTASHTNWQEKVDPVVKGKAKAALVFTAAQPSSARTCARRLARFVREGKIVTNGKAIVFTPDGLNVRCSIAK
jgi:hypothetical protein